MKIIGGIVSYEDGVKTITGDQFSPTRKVRVELNFSLDASDENGTGDAAIEIVLNKAQSFVNGKLGLAMPTAAAKATVTTPPATADEPTPKAPRAPRKPKDADELTTGDTGKMKADLAKDAGVDGTIKGKNEDALELSAPKPVAKPEAPLNDDISDLMGGVEAAKPITDADLNDLAQKTMQRINQPENPGGPRIRELVKKYLPEGAQPVMAKIPQERRAEFKTELEALKIVSLVV